jgi:hypothetical protein
LVAHPTPDTGIRPGSWFESNGLGGAFDLESIALHDCCRVVDLDPERGSPWAIRAKVLRDKLCHSFLAGMVQAVEGKTDHEIIKALDRNEICCSAIRSRRIDETPYLGRDIVGVLYAPVEGSSTFLTVCLPEGIHDRNVSSTVAANNRGGVI